MTEELPTALQQHLPSHMSSANTILTPYKTPAQAFTLPADKKMGTKLTFMYMQLLRQW